MAYYFNDLFMHLGIQGIVTPSQAKLAIKSIDLNKDGLVDKKEMFYAFKYLLNTQQYQIPYQYYPMNLSDDKYLNNYYPKNFSSLLNSTNDSIRHSKRNTY